MSAALLARTRAATIVAFAVGVPFASGLATGAFGIPHNDDWAYSRIAFEFAEHGELKLVGWNQMSLVGLLVWSLPFLWLFGVSLESLHAGQTLAAALGLVLAYLVLRRFLSTGLALLGPALVGVFPGYALLATSYMTDTTAFAAQMGCLLLGLLALERDGRARGLLLLALGVGLYGYTIREAAIDAPLGVLGGSFVAAGDGGERRKSAGLAAGSLFAATAFFVWRHSLSGDEEPWLLGDAFGLRTRRGRGAPVLHRRLRPAAGAGVARHPGGAARWALPGRSGRPSSRSWSAVSWRLALSGGR